MRCRAAILGLLFLGASADGEPTDGMALGRAPAARCHLASYRPVADGSLTYRSRGDRCEGLFSAPVASNSLRLLAYQTGRFAALPFRGAASVLVNGTAGSPGEVLLRALTTRPLTNYAMDTTALVNGRYSWDASVLSAPSVAMKANELALAACSNQCLERPDTLYYPVTLTEPNASSSAGLHVVLQSQRELMRVSYVLTDGRGVAVDSGTFTRTFPARRPVDIPIRSMRAGVYSLRVEAAATAGSQALLTARLVQP